MSKGLEAFNYIFDEAVPMPDLDANVRAKLFKSMDIIEKELKALEIIKNKPQYQQYLIQLGIIRTYEEYEEQVRDWDSDYWDMEYTREEFELLKEVLCNDK